ncbi:MAG: hypothetical protein WDO73_02760 [Ignavibacteriota bacterium]
MYYALLAYQADYTAGGLAAAIALDVAAGVITDGSAVDGRTPITGTSLQNLIAGINALVTQMQTNVVGVGSPLTTIAGAIQVNGSPR